MHKMRQSREKESGCSTGRSKCLCLTHLMMMAMIEKKKERISRGRRRRHQTWTETSAILAAYLRDQATADEHLVQKELVLLNALPQKRHTPRSTLRLSMNRLTYQCDAVTCSQQAIHIKITMAEKTKQNINNDMCREDKIKHKQWHVWRRQNKT